MSGFTEDKGTIPAGQAVTITAINPKGEQTSQETYYVDNTHKKLVITSAKKGKIFQETLMGSMHPLALINEGFHEEAASAFLKDLGRTLGIVRFTDTDPQKMMVIPVGFIQNPEEEKSKSELDVLIARLKLFFETIFPEEVIDLSIPGITGLSADILATMDPQAVEKKAREGLEIRYTIKEEGGRPAQSPSEVLCRAYNQFSGRLMQTLVGAYFGPDLSQELQKDDVHLVLPQCAQYGFYRNGDSIEFIAMGSIDYIEVADGGPLEMHAEFEERYRVHANGTIENFPYSITVKGEDTALFTSLLNSVRAKEKVDQLKKIGKALKKEKKSGKLKKENKIQALIRLIEQTQSQTFDNPMSLYQRIRNITKLLDLLVTNDILSPADSQLFLTNIKDLKTNLSAKLSVSENCLGLKPDHAMRFYQNVIAPFITEATHSIQEKTISTFLNLQGQVSITHLSDEQLKRVISSLTFVESTLKKGPEAAKKAFEFLSKQADSAKDPAEARLYLMLFDKLIFESALSLKSKKDEQSEMLTRYATKAIALYYQMTREISPDTYPALDEAFIRSLIELSKKSTQNPEDFKAYCIAACDLLPLENPLETYLVSTLLLNKMKECSLYAKKPEEVQKLYTTTWVKEVGDDYHVDWMGSVDKHQQLITPPATPTDTLSRRSSSSSLRTPSPTPFLAAHQSGKSSPQPDSEQGIHPK